MRTERVARGFESRIQDSEQTLAGLNEEKDDDENGETAMLKHAALLSCWVFAHTFAPRLNLLKKNGLREST